MGKVALRGIRAHVVKFMLSLLAVALGVSFVAGTFSLRTMLSSTFSGIVDSSTTGDTYVRGAHASAGGSGGDVVEQRNPIPMALTEKISTVDGVRLVIPDIAGSVVLVGADGTAVTSTQAPSFATALSPEDPSAKVVTGRAPSGPGEIALESATLTYSGLHVGDATRVVLAGKVQPVDVVGEVSMGAPMAGATIVLLDPAVATTLFAPDGTVPSIAVYADAGVSEKQLAERVGAVLPAEAAAVTGDSLRAEARAGIEKMLGFVSTFLLVFAGISLFVGAFIIANTFSMSVRQRMREFALLRAVGASPVQVFVSILVQAAVIGAAGSALGVAGGLGLVSILRVVFERMGMTLSGTIPMNVSTVVMSVAVGTLVSLAAAILPARRAALVPPVEAMRDDVVEQERSLRLRSIGGWLLAGLGAAAVVAAVVNPDADAAGTALGLGAAGVVLGMLLLAPALARVVIRILAVPFVAAVRPVGRLARGNVVRNPRRTATTAGALMIGMALVGGASVLAASTQASTDEVIANDLHSDFVVRSATGNVPLEAVDKLREVSTLTNVEPLSAGSVLVGSGSAAAGTSEYLLGMDFAAFGTRLDVAEKSGAMADVHAGDIAVQQRTAKARGWKLGDTVTLTTDTGTRSLTIRAVYESTFLGAAMAVPMTTFTEIVPAEQAFTDTVLVTDAPGTAPADARASIVDVVKPYVVLSVLDSNEFASSLSKQVDQMLVILYALLGLSIIIAVLGIVNTLALSVIERTREIGLLRAVGLGRTQLAGTVTIESVLTAVFGTIVGVGVGVGLASAMPRVFESVGLTTLAIPWASLGGMLALALVVGVLAALWPAVRAARLPVLQAITYE